MNDQFYLLFMSNQWHFGFENLKKRRKLYLAWRKKWMEQHKILFLIAMWKRTHSYLLFIDFLKETGKLL